MSTNQAKIETTKIWLKTLVRNCDFYLEGLEKGFSYISESDTEKLSKRIIATRKVADNVLNKLEDEDNSDS